jgi:hypothetical protein
MLFNKELVLRNRICHNQIFLSMLAKEKPTDKTQQRLPEAIAFEKRLGT